MPNVRNIPDRPMCPACNINLRPIRGYHKKTGEALFRRYCFSCAFKITGKVSYGARNTQKDTREAVFRKRKNMTCELCGFKAEDPCQLDIDHIDGNHKNNDPANHQVLCANCHRLKTKKSKDGPYKKVAPTNIVIKEKWLIKDESGIEFTTSNLSDFCRDNGIKYNTLYGCIKRKKPYKGWFVSLNE